MSQKPNTVTNAEIAETIAMSAGQSGGNSPTAELINQLLLKRLMKEEASEQELLKQQRTAQLENAKAMEMQRRQHEAQQASCPHLKQNGQPHTAGLRDSYGTYHYICQGCQKEFKNYTHPPREGEIRKFPPLPFHLHLPIDKVGGPSD